MAARLAADAGMCLPSLKYEVPAHRFIVPPRNSSIYALRILSLRTPQEDFRVSNFMGQCAPLVNFLIKRKSDPLNCCEVILVDVVRGRFAPSGSCLFVYLFSSFPSASQVWSFAKFHRHIVLFGKSPRRNTEPWL